MTITKTILPDDAILHSLRTRPEVFVDCFTTRASGPFDLADYVAAFYTTPLFRVERVILGWAGHRSNGDQARALASGDADDFAAWRVAERNSEQILLRDKIGRTASWLMARPATTGDSTQLWFGSAVLPKAGAADGSGLGPVFHALMGFHNAYSRALLAAARTRLQRHK